MLVHTAHTYVGIHSGNIFKRGNFVIFKKKGEATLHLIEKKIDEKFAREI